LVAVVAHKEHKLVATAVQAAEYGEIHTVQVEALLVKAIRDHNLWMQMLPVAVEVPENQR
jgi:hypothetical protein